VTLFNHLLTVDFDGRL